MLYSRSQEDIRRLRELAPIAFIRRFVLPEEYSVPGELQFDYMAYRLAKTFRISKRDALEFTELDYWKMLAFENLDSERNEYIRKQLTIRS